MSTEFAKDMPLEAFFQLIDAGWQPPRSMLSRVLEPDPEAWRAALNAYYDIAGRKMKASTPLDQDDLENASYLAYAFKFAPKTGTET